MLCSAIVEMSKGSLFCCRDAEPADEVEPATCDCAAAVELVPDTADDVAAACVGAPVALPPATTVICEPAVPAEACVCNVEGEGADMPVMEPVCNWNG